MRVTLAIVLMCWCLITAAPTAHAEEKVECVKRNAYSVCTATITIESVEPEAVGSTGSGGATDDKCYSTNGAEVPCRIDGGYWYAPRLCYINPVADPPPKTDPVWQGNDDGTIFKCISGGNVETMFWAPAAEMAQPPNPRDMARTAVSQMNLKPIKIGSFPMTQAALPDAKNWVGLNMWLWVADPTAETYGPNTTTVTESGYTLTATAEVNHVIWDFGNGDQIRCGQGQPFLKEKSKNEKSPTCGYFYPKQGNYDITATSYWEIEWEGVGQSGVITMELSVTESVTVGELQVVNVPN